MVVFQVYKASHSPVSISFILTIENYLSFHFLDTYHCFLIISLELPHCIGHSVLSQFISTGKASIASSENVEVAKSSTVCVKLKDSALPL